MADLLILFNWRILYERQDESTAFLRPKDVRYEDTDIPQINSGEALVRIKSALTCGSDLKTYRRGHPTMIEKGSVFGHE